MLRTVGKGVAGLGRLGKRAAKKAVGTDALRSVKRNADNVGLGKYIDKLSNARTRGKKMDAIRGKFNAVKNKAQQGTADFATQTKRNDLDDINRAYNELTQQAHSRQGAGTMTKKARKGISELDDITNVTAHGPGLQTRSLSENANLQDVADLAARGEDLTSEVTSLTDITDAKLGAGAMAYGGQRRARGRSAVPRPEFLGGGRLD